MKSFVHLKLLITQRVLRCNFWIKNAKKVACSTFKFLSFVLSYFFPSSSSLLPSSVQDFPLWYYMNTVRIVICALSTLLPTTPFALFSISSPCAPLPPVTNREIRVSSLWFLSGWLTDGLIFKGLIYGPFRTLHSFNNLQNIFNLVCSSSSWLKNRRWAGQEVKGLLAGPSFRSHVFSPP